jgi:hypothetical protein
MPENLFFRSPQNRISGAAIHQRETRTIGVISGSKFTVNNKYLQYVHGFVGVYLTKQLETASS